MDRIVVGVDGSAAAEAAVGWAARLAARAGAEWVVAHSFAPAQAKLPPERYEALRGEATEGVHAWAAPAEQARARVRAEVTDGEPVGALLSVADRERADLLVVGTRGAGGFAGLHLGSVAHHLAHHTTRPLGIIPLQGAELPPDTIVLGVDGSTGSDAAVRWTAALAPAIGARVMAVHATEPSLEWLPRVGSPRLAPESRGRGRALGQPHPARRWRGTDRHRSQRAPRGGSGPRCPRARRRPGRGRHARSRRLPRAALGSGPPIQLVHHLGRPVVMVPPPA